jgi:hypothetical protein
MMHIGKGYAVICLESIASRDERHQVTKQLQQEGLEIVEISYQQMSAFVGNMLQLTSTKNKELLVMSESAHTCLSKKQIKSLEKYCSMIPIQIPTIEKIGGGSIRCMMAEIFLPRKKNRK